MKKRINKVLDIVQKHHNTRVLFASESGSRAWGFESKDSDWDIRFVYVSSIDYYFNIFSKKDYHLDIMNSPIIKKFKEFELDFVGWDIKKVLFEFYKGNPDLISWFFSPIIYKSLEPETSILTDIAKEFFKSKAAFYHYIHMARKNYQQYIKNPEGSLVNTKKYLYVLRPLLCCIWLEEFNSIPPMKFSIIYTNATVIKKIIAIKDSLNELLFDKMMGLEMDMRPRIPIIDSFCESNIAHFEDLAIVVEDADRIEESVKLNKIFSQIVKGELYERATVFSH